MFNLFLEARIDRKSITHNKRNDLIVYDIIVFYLNVIGSNSETRRICGPHFIAKLDTLKQTNSDKCGNK